jgi:hypothetical protein
MCDCKICLFNPSIFAANHLLFISVVEYSLRPGDDESEFLYSIYCYFDWFGGNHMTQTTRTKAAPFCNEYFIISFYILS